MTDRAVYNYLNGLWPKGMKAPTGREAASGVKRLWRHATGRPLHLPIVFTSGNRHTWTGMREKVVKGRIVRERVLYVNPDKAGWMGGWRAIVHDLAHLIWARRQERPELWPRRDAGNKPHDPGQAYLERDLVEYAVKAGFPEGRHVRPEAAPRKAPDVVVQRYKRMVARERAWATKLARAERALAKVRSEIKAYEQRHGDRLQDKGETDAVA